MTINQQSTVELDLAGANATLTLQIPDIRCANCAFRIEESVMDMFGIVLCRTNVASKQVVIEHDPEQVTSGKIQQHLRDIGFDSLKTNESTDTQESNRSKAMLSRLGVAGIGAMQVMMFALVTYVSGPDGVEPAYIKLMQWASFALSTPVALYSAVPFYQGALRDLQHLRVGMDVPVSLAILSAYCLSTYHMLTWGEVYFDSVCMFTFLLLLGRFLELRSQQRYQHSVSLAERCLPDVVRVLDDRETVSLVDVKIDDCVIASQGETIPVDGVVRYGQCLVSEAAFTGESTALNRQVGSRVLAGSEVLDGEVHIQCDRDPKNTVVAGLSTLYQNAMLYKPRFSLLADKVARYFVAAILAIAFLSGAYWYLAGNPEWFVILITVLVVSCPCALSLATPIAYTVAVTALKQSGVVIRAGKFLEQLAQVDHIVFDKTGTLTEGQLTIAEVSLFDVAVSQGWDSEKVLDYCAALEVASAHPIARAFQTDTLVVAQDIVAHPGFGVEGKIGGRVYALGRIENEIELRKDAIDASGTLVQLSCKSDSGHELVLAVVRLTDDIRQSSVRLVEALQDLYPTTLLSGDSSVEVGRVASILGVEDWAGHQTPADKVEFVQQLQAQGKRVLMIGDGFNDAAAMAVADAAIAVSPVDILVQEAADASLLRQDVLRIHQLLGFSHKLKSIVQQNIVWALGYNLCVIPLAISGALEPWMAALGMSASSLLVVLNAGRLQGMDGAELKPWK